MSGVLKIRDVTHGYEDEVTLRRFSMSLESGRIGCLLGPSGSGKTTLLRLIAGFEEVSEGEIIINTQTMSKPGYALSPEKRNVGIVFQDYALFPHLTVRENVEIGIRDLPQRERVRNIEKWMELVGLAALQDRYPHELSGGESQRVAIARAMAPQPNLLLLDEPFSNLDVELREYLSMEIRQVLKENKVTTLMVTHDQNEAFSIADEVGVLNMGKIAQWGSPYDIYHKPANRFIADFIGQGSFVQGEVVNEKTLQSALGELSVERAMPNAKGSNVEIFFRPDDVLHDDDSPMQAKVMHKAFRGAYILYTLQLPSGEKVLSHVPSHHNHALGSSIGIRLEADHVIWFPL